LKGASPVREETVKDTLIKDLSFLLHSLGSGFESLVTHPFNLLLHKRRFFDDAYSKKADKY